MFGVAFESVARLQFASNTRVNRRTGPRILRVKRVAALKQRPLPEPLLLPRRRRNLHGLLRLARRFVGESLRAEEKQENSDCVRNITVN